jgi:fatty-acyl-CoA synthase
MDQLDPAPGRARAACCNARSSRCRIRNGRAPALLVITAGAQRSIATLVAHIRPKVAKWWLPDAVEFLDAFPMTATGKIHKLTLRRQFADYRVAGTDQNV